MLIRIAAKEQMMIRIVRMRTDTEVIVPRGCLHPRCHPRTVTASYDWNAGMVPGYYCHPPRLTALSVLTFSDCDSGKGP